MESKEAARADLETSPQTDSDISVQVPERNGAGGERTYFLLTPEFLLTDHPLTFDVFVHVRAGNLRRLLRCGQIVPSSLKSEIQREEFLLHLYVKSDSREAALRFQEDAIGDILDAPQIAPSLKCHAIHGLTTTISKQLFESPVATNIRHQRRNVARMVDFALDDPAAIDGLLRLTHHDYYTYTHSVNVGLYGVTIMMNNSKGESREHLHNIASGFFLHDIGKCRVDPEIINKPHSLTEDEWSEIHKHPAYGVEILEKEEGKPLPAEMHAIITQHHERPDGTGYPKGLSGNSITPQAQLCSVLDAFDALTTNRSYKKGTSAFEALSIMKEDVGTQFDPEIFQAFVSLMGKKRMRKGGGQDVPLGISGDAKAKGNADVFGVTDVAARGPAIEPLAVPPSPSAHA